MAAAQTINITGAAGVSKIRSRTKTEKGATGTKTRETRDPGRMVRAQTKTDADFVHEKTTVQVRNTAFPEATPCLGNAEVDSPLTSQHAPQSCQWADRTIEHGWHDANEGKRQKRQ